MENSAENPCALRLRAVIDARGQTLRAFSDEAEVKYRSLQDYVSGKSTPGFEQLQKMSAVGVDVMYLLNGVHSSPYVASQGDEAAASSFIASHRGVLDLLRKRLSAFVDELNSSVVNDQGKSLRLLQLIAIYDLGMSQAIEVIGKMNDNLTELSASGIELDAIVSMIFGVVAKNVSAKVDAGYFGSVE